MDKISPKKTKTTISFSDYKVNIKWLKHKTYKKETNRKPINGCIPFFVFFFFLLLFWVLGSLYVWVQNFSCHTARKQTKNCWLYYFFFCSLTTIHLHWDDTKMYFCYFELSAKYSLRNLKHSNGQNNKQNKAEKKNKIKYNTGDSESEKRKNTLVHFFSYFSFIVPLATAINNLKLHVTDVNTLYVFVYVVLYRTRITFISEIPKMFQRI